MSAVQLSYILRSADDEKRKAVGRLDHRDGMAFNVVRSPCASSWVKKQQKQQAIESEKINKEWKNGGNQKRRWWNDETRGLAWAHSERSRVMYVLYTEGKEAVRQAKNKDSRTDVNHVGVSNALSSLGCFFFFVFFLISSTVSKRLNCVCVREKRARRRFCYYTADSRWLFKAWNVHHTRGHWHSLDSLRQPPAVHKTFFFSVISFAFCHRGRKIPIKIKCRFLFFLFPLNSTRHRVVLIACLLIVMDWLKSMADDRSKKLSDGNERTNRKHFLTAH
jgi:hypothetical protein